MSLPHDCDVMIWGLTQRTLRAKIQRYDPFQVPPDTHIPLREVGDKIHEYIHLVVRYLNMWTQA